MPFYFTFVRHGQTFCNTGCIVQGGRTGGELTDKGKEMARCLGRLLAEENETFTRIYSSDLNRCVQTTAQIVEQLKTTVPEVEYTPMLRERDYGDWEGQRADMEPIKVQIAQQKLAPHEHHKIQVPNSESYEETRARAAKFFEGILKLVDVTDDDQVENVLVVSHGTLLVCLIEYLAQNEQLFNLENFDVEKLKNIKAENTCRTRFTIAKAQPKATGNSKRDISFTHFFDTEHYKYLST